MPRSFRFADNLKILPHSLLAPQVFRSGQLRNSRHRGLAENSQLLRLVAALLSLGRLHPPDRLRLLQPGRSRSLHDPGSGLVTRGNHGGGHRYHVALRDHLPLTAWMITRIGARKTIVIGGCIAASAAFLMSWLGHVYPLFVTLGIFLGLGVSMSAMIPVQTVAIAWFHARRALALGLVLGGGAVGGFLAPQFINWVVMRAGGNWRIGFLLISTASLAGAVVALLAVRNRPWDLGQHPDGMAPRNVTTSPPARSAQPAPTARTMCGPSVRS